MLRGGTYYYLLSALGRRTKRYLLCFSIPALARVYRSETFYAGRGLAVYTTPRHFIELEAHVFLGTGYKEPGIATDPTLSRAVQYVPPYFLKRAGSVGKFVRS